MGLAKVNQAACLPPPGTLSTFSQIGFAFPCVWPCPIHHFPGESDVGLQKGAEAPSMVMGGWTPAF